jgi:hypothetical protein
VLLFKLERPDGTLADPPTLRLNVYRWHAGDTIPLGKRNLRVVGVRDDDADQPPALIDPAGDLLCAGSDHLSARSPRCTCS